MQTFFYIVLFIFGALFGSFASVLIHRLHSKEKGILNGRSHCFSCKKTLKAHDLFPIFSYLSTFGKCRYCKKKIPLIYPILELSTGIIFVLTGMFLVDVNLILSLDYFEILKLDYWLIIGFITILYIFYDILFLEIHEGIMLTGIILAFVGVIFGLVPTIEIISSVNILAFSVILGIIILAGLYVIMLKELKEVYDILIIIFCVIFVYLFKKYLGNTSVISALIGALGIFIFFYLQILFSKGRALGGGDLRIGIMVGLLLGMSYSFIGMFMTYLVGSILSILLILYKKLKEKKKKVSTVVPFGPFIGLGFFITIFFLEDINKLIEIYFGVL